VLRTLNRRTSPGTLHAFALWRRSNLKCVFTKIIKINHKSITQNVTVKVIRSKLIIVISKERKDFRARILVQFFLNAPKSLSGSAAMLIISRMFSLKLLQYQYVSVTLHTQA